MKNFLKVLDSTITLFIMVKMNFMRRWSWNTFMGMVAIACQTTPTLSLLVVRDLLRRVFELIL